MRTKAENPAARLEGKNAPALVEAYFEFNHLKQLYRQGWLRRGIPPDRCESVAEHTFGVAMLALFLAEAHFPELDADRVLRLALLHDFGEVYAGDIIPGDGVPPEEKKRREAEAAARVLAKLPNGAANLRLWEEYEHGATPEARFVKAIDRLEMALQAGVYQAQGFEGLQEFFDTARIGITHPQLRDIIQSVEELTGR